VTDARRQLRAKSDELLSEADRLRDLEHEVDALPLGSLELIEVAREAETQGERVHELAEESEALTREAAEPEPARE
jgi:hypothetical protein